MNHNLTTNFGFIKELANAKNLGNIKINWSSENEAAFYRTIYFKKSANEFKSIANARRLELVEYKNNKIVTTNKLKQ